MDDMDIDFRDEESSSPIVSYTVRQFGCHHWSAGHKTLSEAMRARDTANRVCTSGHHVFAEHANGDVTGPYDN